MAKNLEERIKESGDVVEVTTPGGSKSYEITKVEWI